MSTNEQGDGGKKLYSILSYFSLWIIGLIQMPKDEDVKFHVNQGIIISIGWVAFGLLSWVLALIPVLGWILLIAIPIFLIVLMILGAIAANKGELKELPLIGKIKIIK